MIPSTLGPSPRVFCGRDCAAGAGTCIGLAAALCAERRRSAEEALLTPCLAS